MKYHFYAQEEKRQNLKKPAFMGIKNTVEKKKAVNKAIFFHSKKVVFYKTFIIVVSKKVCYHQARVNGRKA